MSAADLAAVLAAVAAMAVVAALVVVLGRLRQSAAELADTVDELRRALSDSVGRVERLTAELDDEMHRVNGLVDTAEAVSARADTLSKVTYGAVAKPVIKTAAVVKGTSRAARLLRRGGDELDEQAG